MTLNVAITPLAEARLRGFAAQAGTDIDHYVSQLIERIAQEGPDALRTEPASQNARPIGLSKGAFEVPAGFFDPLPNEILDAFEGVPE
jgi:hypothetical protein